MIVQYSTFLPILYIIPRLHIEKKQDRSLKASLPTQLVYKMRILRYSSHDNLMEENDTLNKILSIAQEEFLSQGFQGASLRAIVKKAGVTTGAFYGYFESKEALFDALVQEHAAHIMRIYDELLAEFETLPLERQKASMDSYSSTGLQAMFEYAWQHKTAFSLIARSSAGTRYENFIQELAQKDMESTEHFYQLLESQGTQVERVDPMIEQLVITGTFSSFFALILRDIPRKEAEHGLSQLFRFYRSGWNGLMHFSD